MTQKTTSVLEDLLKEAITQVAFKGMDEKARRKRFGLAGYKLAYVLLVLLAMLLLLVGFWQLLELWLGPVLAPLVLAGGCAVLALVVQGYMRYKQKYLPPVEISSKDGGLRRSLALTLFELWVTPKTMRKQLLLVMALHWMNRKLSGRDKH